MKCLEGGQAPGTIWSSGSQYHEGLALFLWDSFGSVFLILYAGFVSRQGARAATTSLGFSSTQSLITVSGKTFVHILKFQHEYWDSLVRPAYAIGQLFTHHDWIEWSNWLSLYPSIPFCTLTHIDTHRHCSEVRRHCDIFEEKKFHILFLRLIHNTSN